MKLKTIQFSKATDISKGWGKEVQIVNNIVDREQFPTGYSGKLLVYTKAGAASSMHFHTVKHETFYIVEGEFLLCYYNPENANRESKDLTAGDVVIIPPNNPHRLYAKTKGTIIEFASSDFSWDNYRIEKGDSQTILDK